MDQFIAEYFNQTSSLYVNCKKRINNIVTNAQFGQVEDKLSDTFPNYAVTFSTFRKGKPTQGITYLIAPERLTEIQSTKLLLLSLLPKS